MFHVKHLNTKYSIGKCETFYVNQNQKCETFEKQYSVSLYIVGHNMLLLQ